MKGASVSSTRRRTRLGLMRPGAVLLNFSREGVASNVAIVDALNAGSMSAYVCDFPSAELHAHPRVVALPHLGASTREAEENCALMVVDQLRDYLEHGQITHAVNFPAVQLARAGLNIHNMVNKSRGEMAYTLVDVEAPAAPEVLAELRAIHCVLAVRYLPAR